MKVPSELQDAFERSRRIYRNAQHLASLQDFLQPFVKAGDLVFDIGAHVGDRTLILRKLGAKVIALEPQPFLAKALQEEFAPDPNVTIIQAGVGAEAETAILHVNSANPTVSTLSSKFIDAAQDAEGWQDQRWDHSETIEITTLDSLIQRYGIPAFIKIDVEGFEDRALKGLTSPVPALSFEITTIARDIGLNALDGIHRLGPYQYRLSLGETHRFHHSTWLDFDAMRQLLGELPADANSGDVYARFPDT